MTIKTSREPSGSPAPATLAVLVGERLPQQQALLLEGPPGIVTFAHKRQLLRQQAGKVPGERHPLRGLVPVQGVVPVDVDDGPLRERLGAVLAELVDAAGQA